MWNTDPEAEQDKRSAYYGRLQERAKAVQKQAQEETKESVKNKQVEPPIKQQSETKLKKETSESKVSVPDQSNIHHFDPSQY